MACLTQYELNMKVGKSLIYMWTMLGLLVFLWYSGFLMINEKSCMVKSRITVILGYFVYDISFLRS